MTPTDPPTPPPPPPAPPPGGPGDPSEADLLAELRERISQTQAAAERIAAEAAAAAAAAAARAVAEPPRPRAGPDPAAPRAERPGHRPPPLGYAVPGGNGDGSRGAGSDLQALVGLLELLRGIVPPELQQQLAELVKEILQLLRAVIDWYLERSERQRTEPVEVEDIPIT